MTLKNGKRGRTFANWIERVGETYLARRLWVTPTTVRNWKRGACDPRVDQMREINRMTRGQITYSHMIDRAGVK